MKLEPQASGQPAYVEWIKENMKGKKIGVHGGQVPTASFESRQAFFKGCEIELVSVNNNLVDEVWVADAEDPKPPLP